MLVNGYLAPTTLLIDIESLHVDNDIGIDNALGLTPAELKMRKVETLDIRTSHCDPSAKGYRAAHDMSKWRSAKKGRGPLTPGWEVALVTAARQRLASGAGASAAGAEGASPTPVMCAYKVVRTSVHIFGLAGTVEGSIVGQQRGLFASSLCQAVATLDDWADITPEQLRAMEAETARISNEKLAKTVKSAAALPAAKKGAAAAASGAATPAAAAAPEAAASAAAGGAAPAAAQ